jgi:flagellar hook-length control protein FliK
LSDKVVSKRALPDNSVPTLPATPAPGPSWSDAHELVNEAVKTSVQQTSPAPNADSGTVDVARAVAGKALARALTALASDTQLEKPGRGSNPTVVSIARVTQASSVAPLVQLTASVAPAEPPNFEASVPAATPEVAQSVAKQAPDPYSLAAAMRSVDPEGNHEAPVETVPASSVPLDSSTRGLQPLAAVPRAPTDIEVDTNIVKLRQAAIALQTPVRTDLQQVQASQSGQQASIEIATPVLTRESTEPGTVADQIVKAIRIQVRDGIGEVRLRLQPEHLGEVQIELKVDRDRVSAVLHVERPEVRAQIESQGQTLRASLASQGLQLEELTVRDDGERRDGGQRGSQEMPERRRRQHTTKHFELEES